MKERERGILLGFLIAIACGACNKADPGSSTSASSSAKSVASSSAAPASGALGVGSLEVTWTGQWKAGDHMGSNDTAADEYPLMSVTNKDTTRPLTFYEGWFYFYDKDKKQLGRVFKERYQFKLAPGEKTDLVAGLKKADVPAGTDKMDFVVTGAHFGSDAAKFTVPTPPPETRPMGG